MNFYFIEKLCATLWFSAVLCVRKKYYTELHGEGTENHGEELCATQWFSAVLGVRKKYYTEFHGEDTENHGEKNCFKN